ncbi:hypothetical protein J3458_022169 [Metarhizium acridum]|uniref:uncharacterized protein n=1 Tax=Metarhizium acridum TaxID=92637 RepID=UPI001C6BA711|nr:hypothetical protein J3458_022169 [Metarhizium acridum]
MLHGFWRRIITKSDGCVAQQEEASMACVFALSTSHVTTRKLRVPSAVVSKSSTRGRIGACAQIGSRLPALFPGMTANPMAPQLLGNQEALPRPVFVAATPTGISRNEQGDIEMTLASLIALHSRATAKGSKGTSGEPWANLQSIKDRDRILDSRLLPDKFWLQVLRTQRIRRRYKRRRGKVQHGA